MNLLNEIVLMIFSYFRPADLLSVSLTCKLYYDLSRDNIIWKNLVYKRAGLKYQTEEIIKKAAIVGWLSIYKSLNQTSHFIECSECKLFPIDGSLYKCLNCKFYASCEPCFIFSEHPNTHVVIKTYSPNSHLLNWNFVHNRTFNLSCCQCSTPITDKLLECKNCQNIKLCVDCYNTQQHQTAFPTHQFYEIIQPVVVNTDTCDSNEIPTHYAFCDECRANGIDGNMKGLRFRCAVCYDYDLCEKCELTMNHFEKEHPFMLIRFQDMRRQLTTN